MPLRTDKLAQMIEEGRRDDDDPFVVEPMTKDALRQLKERPATALDVRLGRWFLTLRRPHRSVIGLPDADTPQMNTAAVTSRAYRPFGGKFFLHPGEFVLGSTLEWFRFPRSYCGQILGKSSWGRRGLIVETASVIHPGFCGCLTLEIANLGSFPLALEPGMEIGQVVVEKLDDGSLSEKGAGSFGGFRRPELGQLKRDEFLCAVAASGAAGDTG